MYIYNIKENRAKGDYNMSIPKIIHYCWFGRGEKSDLIKQCIQSWGKLDGYIIKEWNEDNFDINSHPYVKEAYKNKKYAFVSDFVRLKVLYEEGGIYLDTDVEIKKDFSDFLTNNLFVGFMYDCLLGTAVIGSSSGNEVLLEMLNMYDKFKLEDNPNNNYFTQYFLDNFKDFRLNNKLQVLNEKITVYPKEYFERPTFKSIGGYSEHHYTGTWKRDNNKKKLLKNIIVRVIGKTAYKMITHKLALKKTPYYSIYLNHKKE